VTKKQIANARKAMLLGYKIAPYNGKRDEGQVILIRKNKSKGMNYET
jgi:hypothetical protein